MSAASHIPLLNPNATPFQPRRSQGSQRTTNCNNLKLFVTNAFVLKSKFGELQHCLQSTQPDLAVATETKLTADKMSLAECTIPGYAAPIRCDHTGQGGGIAVWVKSDLCFRHLDPIDCKGFEVIWLLLETSSHGKIIVCEVYRSGSTSGSDCSLVEYLEDTLEDTPHLGDYLLITGDFNVHRTAWLNSNRTTPAGDALETLCAAYGLDQLVTEPTRGTAILDLVLADLPGTTSSTVGKALGRSDHSTITVDFSSVLPQCEESSSRTVWRYRKADWQRRRAFYPSTDWLAMTTACDDPNTAWASISSRIHDGMHRFIPHKELVTTASDPRWWTPECSSAIAQKHSAWKRWSRSNASETLKAAYVQAVTNAVSTLQQAQLSWEEHLKQKLRTGNLRDKLWWSTIKPAAGKERHSEIPTLVDSNQREHLTAISKAECFGAHFSQKCSLGGDNLSPTDIPDHIPPTPYQFMDVHFRVPIVRKHLSRLDPGKATCPDQIPACVPLRNAAMN